MKKIIFTIIVVIVSFVANSQTVSEIVPSVAGDKIQINFTVSGLKYFQEVKKVGVSVSRNGGDFIPIKEITGDNWDIYKDGRYKIIWDQLKEVSFTGEDLIFEITLLIDKKKKSFFIMLAGNDVTPIGLRLGLLGKVGFYVEARSSLLAMQNPGYTYVGSTIIDYDKPGFYEFSDKEGWQSYTALVGVTYQLFRSGFVYAGCGYGIENYIMEFKNTKGALKLLQEQVGQKVRNTAMPE